MSDYDDIINLDRPLSKHNKLSIDSRASQFAPFSALTGYDSAIKETTRITEKKVEIDDDARKMINSKLNYLDNNIKVRNEITIKYFIKDKKKDGGKYITINGKVKKIDSVNETVKLEDNTVISMKDIININGKIFEHDIDS